jgi:hypothetical protein
MSGASESYCVSMATVISETGISLTSLTDPHVSIPGKLLSLQGRFAELTMEGEMPLNAGSLVEFQSPDSLYLGEIESAWTEGSQRRLRVLIEHSVNLERADAIRRLWNAGA